MKIQRILIACIISYLACGTFIPANLHDPVDHEAAKESVQVHDLFRLLAVDRMPYLLSKVQEEIERFCLKPVMDDQLNIRDARTFEKFCRGFSRLALELKNRTTLGPKYDRIKADAARAELEGLIKDFCSSIPDGTA